jgi:hypothetical protein
VPPTGNLQNFAVIFAVFANSEAISMVPQEGFEPPTPSLRITVTSFNQGLDTDKELLCPQG